jgi:predicted PurR-regulated permease PerM
VGATGCRGTGQDQDNPRRPLENNKPGIYRASRMSTAPDTPERTLPPPWDRLFSLATRGFVWGVLIAILYMLRPFLLLVFLTFVFAYIQAHGVDGLAHRVKNRTVRVVFVGLVFLGTLFATGFTLLPQIQVQASSFLQNREKYIKSADAELNKVLKQWPSIYDSLIKHKTAPDPSLALEQPALPVDETATKPVETKPAETKPPPELHLVDDLIKGTMNALNPLDLGQSVLGYASAFLLSLLFSFLIVLDLPKLSKSVKGLSRTRLAFMYEEAADNIAGFGRVLGKALEAQLFIAVCNTILTAIGIWAMGIPNLLVLSTIVFFCSFIPVAGTFISSTPICLLALQSGGATAMVIAIIMIAVIHALETYVLNPAIYGHHMHMNPVLVLIILTICGQLFGVWGLILGIPIMNYVFRHAIRRAEERPAGA